MQLCLNSGFSVAEADVGLSVIVLTEFLRGEVVFLIIMGQFCHDIKLSAKTGSQTSYLMVLGISIAVKNTYTEDL